MITLGIDPGGTTGLVSVRCPPRGLPQPEDLLHFDQVTFWDMPAALERELDERRPDLVAIERFQISPRTVKYTRQPEALYVIGAVLFRAEVLGITVKMQDAASAKSAYSNEQLKGWAVKGTHAKDALRHALLSCHPRMM